ncbi:MAG: TonB-dependent receptor [Rhizomicrobium sp.]
MRRSYRQILLASAAAFLAAPQLASAQDAPPPDKTSNGIEFVVVTASKQGAARAQDLPVSITAFDGKKLDQLHAFSFDDMITQVPSTNFIDNGGPGRGYEVASIRGLSPVADNTVGVVAQYLDGAPHFTPNYNLFDLSEVSVLRGPQGTLWGAQAIGGLISYRSNRPDLDHFSAMVQEDVSTTSGSGGLSDRTEGMINVPIIQDELAVRAAGYFLDERGYVDNVTTGAKDVNSVKDWAWRGSVLWQPTSDLSVTLIYHGDRLNSGASSFFDIDLPGRETSAPFTPSPAKEHADLVNLLVDYNLGWATLSYSGSYFKMSDVYYQYDLNVLGAVPIAKTLTNDQENSTTHELRLASAPGGPFHWVAGLYYDNYDQDQLQTSNEVVDPAIPGSPAFGDGFAAFAIGGPQRTVEKAAFGEVSYDLLDNLQVLVGGRYFQWSVNNHQQTTYFGSNYNAAVGHVDGDNFSYKAQIIYKPTDDVTLYALRSQGFRPGGFNPFVGPVLNIPESFVLFKPDTLTNYEIGAKTSWFDGRLTLNGAAYWMNWHHIQTVVYNSTGTFAFTTNGPDLTAKGVELELESKDLFFPGLYAAASYSYNTNEFTDGATIFPGVPELIHEGDSLRRTPHHTWSLDAGYDFLLFDDVNAFLRANYWHKAATSTKGFDGNDGDIAVPVQNVVNLQAGVIEGSWQGRLYVNNLTDSRPLEQIFPNAANPAEPAIASSVRPRTIGLEITKTF